MFPSHDHAVDGLVQHIQRELGEDDLMEGGMEELKKNAEAGYDKYMKKGWKMPDKDEYVKNNLAIANKMAKEQGLDKALKAHGSIARDATFTRIDDPVKMSDFLLGKKQ